MKRADLLIVAALALAALLSAALASGGVRSATLAMDAPALFAPRQGFYALEQDPAAGLRYRWTDGAATLLLPNPGGELQIDLWLLHGPADDGALRLGSGGARIDLQLAPALRRYRLLLPPQISEQVALRLESATARVNRRQLGAGLAGAAVVGGPGLPPAVGGLAALAAAALYGLLRRAGGARWRLAAAGLALALAVGAPLWYGLGGWRLGLLSEALVALAGAALLALGAGDRGQGTGGRDSVLAGIAWLGMAAAMAVLLWAALPPFSSPPLSAAIALAAAGGLALLLRAGLPGPAAAALAALGIGVAAACGPLLGPGEVQAAGALGLLGAAALAAALAEPLLAPAADPAPAAPRLTRAEVAALGLLLLAALAVRLPFLGAPDPVGDLELAARRVVALASAGLAGAYSPPGDYLPLRIYILRGVAWLATALGAPLASPPGPLLTTLIKLPQLTADLLTPLLIFAWSRRWLRSRWALGVAALYSLAPPVWINVAWWGQVDALLMLPMLLTVVLLDRAGGRLSWACWAAAILIKPQAVILAPLLYVATLRRHGCRGLAGGAAVAGAIGGLAVLPLALAGQLDSMLGAYVGSVGRFPRATAGAYNLWYLWLGPVARDSDPLLGGLSARALGFALLGATVALVGWGLLRRSDAPARAQAAALLGLAFFCLPTQIHERYLFLSIAPLALCVAPRRGWAWLFLWAVVSATLNVLAELSGFVPVIDATLGQSPLRYALAVANLAALGVGIYMFLREANRHHPRPLSHRRERAGGDGSPGSPVPRRW